MSETEINYRRIARQFYNTPLWLAPNAAQTISAFLFERISAGPRGRTPEHSAGESAQVFQATSPDGQTAEVHGPRASRFAGNYALDDSGRPLPYRRTADGVAIITIVGELVNRGGWIGASSGLISYEAIKYQLQVAAADAKTTHIILDLESPGGEAVGAFEAAAAVREARKAKPVIAVVNGMAASAAYALASAATRIVAMPTGLVGSIGVVMVHLDFSAYLEKEGVKPTMIFSGAHKVDGNPFEPLPDEVRARFQKESTSFYEQFVETVAAGRDGLTAERIRQTEAAIFKGQDAVAAGLADSVGTFEEVLAELSRGTTGRSNVSTPMKGKSMDPNTSTAAVSTAAAITTADQLRTAHPALCTQIETAAATAATTVERTRVAGIDKLFAARTGSADLQNKCKADGLTIEQSAMALVEHDNAKLAAARTGIAAVEGSTGSVAAAPGNDPAVPGANGGGAKAATPDEWRTQYEASADLRSEFATAADYVAYRSASAEGRVRERRVRDSK